MFSNMGLNMLHNFSVLVHVTVYLKFVYASLQSSHNMLCILFQQVDMYSGPLKIICAGCLVSFIYHNHIVQDYTTSHLWHFVSGYYIVAAPLTVSNDL